MNKIIKEKPILSFVTLFIIVSGCLFCEFFIPKNPMYMDLENCSVPPDSEFWFGTDTMGRDIFSAIWYGGRISLSIGILATVISIVAAVTVGAASAMMPKSADSVIMRFNDIMLSIPGILSAIFLQSVIQTTNILTISIVIGITSWYQMSRIIRTEVMRLKKSEFIIAAKCMGGSFWYILIKHIIPNLFPTIMFMAVINIRSAIITESTLSFMGMGLPLESVSWGTMLSNSESALLTNLWWIIVIPGVFLITTLICITNIGNYIRKRINKNADNI